jgi:uncharacterized OB-fold protein
LLDPGPRDLCERCHSPDLEPADVPGEGSLVAWTTIRRAPTRFKGQAPYVIAVVDLASGLRLTGRIEGDADRLKVALPVRAVDEENGTYLFGERRT